MKKTCYYLHPKISKIDWKPHETKLQLAKQWDKNKGFIKSKPKKDGLENKIKKIKSVASDLDKSESSSNFIRSVRITKHYPNGGNVRRLINKPKDSNFWLNSAANRHLCYDRSLMHNLQPLISPKLAEVADDRLVTVKGIRSITFGLNIQGKLIKNTLIDVKYAPDLNYHMISTNILNRKNCSLTTKDEKLTIIDLEDNIIFMTGTIQPKAKGNFYFLDLWHPPIKKINAVAPTWENWHRRLRHLNIQDMKKLAIMGLISKANRKMIGRCEACMMKKMHRNPNHDLVWAIRRSDRPSQRFHTDLTDGGNIVLISKEKRYAIVFVNDFSDYTWICLMRKKNEF